MRMPPEILRWARWRRRLARANDAGERGPAGIGDPAHEREEKSQPKNLQCGVAAREVHELRQEREKKQHGLGIQQIDQSAWAKDAPEVFVAIGGGERGCVATAQGADAKINDIGGAHIFYALEGQRGGGEDGEKSQGGCGDMNQRASDNAQHGDKSCGAAVRDAGADDVEDSRAGDDQKDDGSGDE